MKKLNFLLILLIVVAVSTVTAQDPHQEGVAQMEIIFTSEGADFVFDGLREESIFTGEPTTMDTVCLLDGTLPEGYSGQFWIAYDDLNIYGYAEITDPDIHAKDEIGITYDFSDPASFTQYGWEGDPVVDDDGAVYTKVEYGNHANVETLNRGTTYLMKDKPGGYTVEWKTGIYDGVTADADIIAAMLERGTFMFDIQLAACTYDADGAFVDRAYLAWNANDNNTWQSSFSTGILTLSDGTTVVDPHQENVAEMEIRSTPDGADFAFDGVREESVFAGEPTTMDTVALLEGTLPEGHAGQFWLAYDALNIYGYAEITDPDIHAKDEVGITYDFSDPASFTQYGWEGDPVADDDGAVYTKVEYGNHANVETLNRGTTYLMKDKPGGYTVEWKTDIYTGVTADADIIAAMLERGTFMFDIQLAACTYDADGAFVDRAYIAWNANDNNTWQSSFSTGIVTLGSPLSIDKNIIEHGDVYPNPVNEVLYIRGDVNSVEFFSITGKLVKRLEQVDGSLDVSDLANGMYLLSIKESTGNIKTVKLLKE